MKVAILAASCNIGKNLAKTLLEKGIEVVGISRNPSNLYEEMGGKIETRNANIFYADQISLAINRCDAVINCIGIIREKGENTFEVVHIQGVINIIHAMKENGIKRLIHISALGAGRGIDTRYFKTKEMGEKFIKESELEWTILRPGVVIGEDGGIFKKIKSLSTFPVLILPDMRAGRTHIISVEDLSKAVFLSLTEKRALNTVVELAGMELSMDDLILKILKKIGKKRMILRIPSDISISLLKIGEKLLNGFLPVNSEEIIMALQKLNSSPSEMAEKFGITPKNPFES